MNKRIRKKKEKQGKYRHRKGHSGILEWTFGYKLVDATLEVLIDGKYVPVNDTQYAPAVSEPVSFEPVGDYLYLSASERLSCGTCTMAGMCQFCARRWPIPYKGGQ